MNRLSDWGLSLSMLESRLVPATLVAPAADPTADQVPVYVGHAADGEAIYSISLAPRTHQCGPGCGCAACLGAAATATLAPVTPPTPIAVPSAERASPAAPPAATSQPAVNPAIVTVIQPQRDLVATTPAATSPAPNPQHAFAKLAEFTLTDAPRDDTVATLPAMAATHAVESATESLAYMLPAL